MIESCDNTENTGENIILVEGHDETIGYIDAFSGTYCKKWPGEEFSG